MRGARETAAEADDATVTDAPFSRRARMVLKL